MPIQVDGVLLYAISGTELSRVRTEFRLRPPEPTNQSYSSRGEPTLLCNQVDPSTNLSGNSTNQELARVSRLGQPHGRRGLSRFLIFLIGLLANGRPVFCSHIIVDRWSGLSVAHRGSERRSFMAVAT
jgi:hypothetical protein